jgi:hypothetical protein
MSFQFKSKSTFEGIEKIISQAKKISDQNKNHVAIGFLKDFDSKYENGEDVVSVAVQNEFGTDKIPARPFMRRTATTIRPKLNQLRINLVKKIIRGEVGIDQALEKIGIYYKNKIKYTINHDEFIKNAPSTIAKKGEGKRPLIDTKRMFKAINYKLVDKGFK